MTAKLLHSRCFDSTSASVRESWLITGMRLGITLLLTVVWMWVAVSYRDPQIRQYVLAFLQLPLLSGVIMTMPLRSLKGRPRATQALLMAGTLVGLIAWCLIVGFVATAL